jgi:hypothetical protein
VGPRGDVGFSEDDKIYPSGIRNSVLAARSLANIPSFRARALKFDTINKIPSFGGEGQISVASKKNKFKTPNYVLLGLCII